MCKIYIENVKKILLSLKNTMIENKQFLIECDSVMGDGDLGLTMEAIFTAANDQMLGKGETNLSKYFMQAGMIMAKTAPSTMGTLIGGAFMSAGKNSKNSEEWDMADLTLFIRGLTEGIMARGKAKLGEKTIVDVLYPVVLAMEASKLENINELLTLANSTAKESLEKTKNMLAQHGRAAYYQEKSKGHIDAGATVGLLIIQSFQKAFLEV